MRHSVDSEHLRDKYPGFFSFGPNPRFLTPDESVSATADERIASIWPYVIRKVMRFSKRIKPRERANFDPEDVAQSIWIMLREKDGGWDPERGPYLTFAGVLIDREFCSIREKSHTVESPRNTTCRIKQFAAEVQEGPMSDKKTRTFEAIKRTESECAGIQNLGGGIDDAIGPLEAIERRDEVNSSRDAVSLAVRGLSPIEARVIGRTFGLWGQPASTSIEVADDLGRRPDYIKQVKAEAIRKIRERLLDMGHPAVASDN